MSAIIRIVWVITVVGGIVAVMVLAGSSTSYEVQSLFVPTRTPAPTPPFDERWLIDGQRRPAYNFTTPGPRLAPESRTSRFTSYAEAESRTGWRILRHPDAESPLIYVTLEWDYEPFVGETVQLGDETFQITQGVPAARFETSDAAYVTRRVGSYDVAFRRDFNNNVRAAFYTGERAANGAPVLAMIIGGQSRDAVLDFVSELTFSDDGNR